MMNRRVQKEDRQFLKFYQVELIQKRRLTRCLTNLPEQNRSSIDQVSENDDYSSAIENEASFEGNAESSELKEVLKSAIMSCNDSIVPSDDDVVVQIETDPELVITGLNSFPQNLIPVEFVMVTNAYQVLDKMAQLTLVWPYEELNANKGSIPLIDCVPKVFDPGDGVETSSLVALLIGGWRFDDRSKTFSIKIDSVSTRLHTFDIMPNQISLEQPKGNGKAIMTVFDPGGILVRYNGCDPFEHNRSCHSCICNGNQNDYDCWFDRLNVGLVYKQMIVFAVTLPVIAGFTREGNDSHTSRKVWANRVSSWDCYSAIELGVKQGIYNIEVNQVSAGQNVAMGSQLLPLTMGWLGKLDCDSNESHGSITYIVSFSFDPGGSCYLLRARNRIRFGLLLVHDICCWILFFDMPTLNNYCWATNMVQVLLIFHPRIFVSRNIFHDSSRFDGIKGLIVLFLKAEFAVSINLSSHNIRLVMTISIWHYISVLLLDGVLWVHMIGIPSVSTLEFNPQVYDPGTSADLVGIPSHSVRSIPFDHGGCYLPLIFCGVCICTTDWKVSKACKPQMQVLVDLSWVKEALDKDDVGLPLAIKFLMEVLIKGTHIIGIVTWQRKLHGHKSVVLAGATVIDNFVWDPGRFGVFIYIIEDKDVFKREGNCMYGEMIQMSWWIEGKLMIIHIEYSNHN